MMQGSLAHRLRVLRAERGLTLREAASLTGVAKETISDIERGLRHPHDPTLAKIAKGYGVPVEDLLEEPVLAAELEDGPSLEEFHATARCATNWLVMPEAEWRAAWSPDLSPREAMSIVHEMTAEISALKPLMDKQERGLPWSRRMFSGHFGKAWWRYFDGLERAKARGEAAGLIGPEGTPKDLAKMLGQEPGKSLDELMLAAS
jgi:transcriptional regulator with XRE-family HTH domain